MLQNAPFRSQIFQIFFASGGKGALTPLTKIPRTFLIRTAAATALCFQPLRPLLRAYGCACVEFSSYELTISSEYGAPPRRGMRKKFLSRAHEIGNVFCVSLRGLRKRVMWTTAFSCCAKLISRDEVWYSRLSCAFCVTGTHYSMTFAKSHTLIHLCAI